jgi:photosystem II stability/assembly factor-like uncharacterized protein
MGSGALIADPADRSTLYAISHSDLLFKSTDRSNTWTVLSGVTGVYSLLIDPKDPATLYAGTAHGVLKSKDGGSTWAGANAGLPQGFPAWAQVLAIDPVNSSVLYVQKWNGVFKSGDGGKSWNELYARFYASKSSTTPLANFQIQKLIIDPHASTMYTWPGSFKSTDGGTTWYPLPIIEETPSAGELWLDPSTSTLYLANSDNDKGRIIKSTDQGTTWTSADFGFPDGAQPGLVFDPNNAGTIYAPYIRLDWSGAPPEFGLAKSTDGGGNWAVIDPAIPDSYIVSLAVAAGSSLYTSYDDSYTGSGEIFTSTNGGANWHAATAGPAVVNVRSLAIDPAKPDVTYALAGLDGVFKSADRGANWTTLTALPIPTDPSGPIPGSLFSLAINSGNSSILYAWTPGHLFRSSDAGMSWQSDVSLPYGDNGDGGFLSMDSHDANTLYLAESDVVEGAGWLLKTADGGLSWNYTWQSRDFPLAVSIAPQDPATIYLGTSNGLLKTTDGGSNWSDTPLHSVVNVLAIDPLRPNVVYAATTSDDLYPFPAGFTGLFKSADAGASWLAVTSGLETLMNTGAPITALALDPANPDAIYAGTSGNGIFRSTDGGAHWSPFNRGLTNFDVRVLAIASGRPDLLYASTSGGIFALSLFPVRFGGQRN